MTIRYPENEVLGIIETREQLEAVSQTLEESGFLDVEISVACGPAAADAMKANTGRSGLAHLAIRVATRLGLQNEESETKDRYERALRENRFVIAVLAPTDERRALAAQLIAAHGGHYINFLGRFSITRLAA